MHGLHMSVKVEAGHMGQGIDWCGIGEQFLEFDENLHFDVN